MEKDYLKELKKPFPAKDIEWRVQSAGENGGKVWAKVLPYVSARAIMDRLDAVFGLFGWRDEYAKAPDGGILCRLSVKPDEGEWITKEDAAENTKVEAVKGGVSSAIKRAAVKFGIGRYLYKVPIMFAIINPNGSHYQSGKKDLGNKNGYPSFKWDSPKLPLWALPDESKADPTRIMVLEEYLSTYKEQKKASAIIAIQEVLDNPTFERVEEMIERIERKTKQGA